MSVALSGPSAHRLIEWGVAARARAGEVESGDCHVVREFPGGVLMAAVDGLGHGQEAASAAHLAAALIEQHAHEDPVVLVQRCHETLAGGRGAVMSVASLEGRTGLLRWIGVGNVEAVLLRSVAAGRRQERLLLRGGIVGHRLPHLESSAVPVFPEDVLVLATDGISAGFAEQLGTGQDPEKIASRVLAEHGRTTDDALVLVARFARRSS